MNKAVGLAIIGTLALWQNAAVAAFASDKASPYQMKSFNGRAHWYGKELHGRPTASGEIFDKDKLTAAHPTLPLGTRVRVHSLHTGKDVIVRINDRCPKMKQRCIDLSEGAARKIGICPRGRADVECTMLGKHDPAELAKSDASPHRQGSPASRNTSKVRDLQSL